MGQRHDLGGPVRRFWPGLIAAVLGLAILPAAARAASTWALSATQGPGDWYDPAHWSASVPTSTTNALIDNGGAALIASGAAAADTLTVAQSAAFTTNTLSMTGGSLILTHDLMIGDQASAGGWVTLSAANLQAHFVTVDNGAGTLTLQNGAATTNDSLILGAAANSAGTVNVWDSASSLHALLLTVGNAGHGLLNIAGGGGLVSTGEARLGYVAQAIGAAGVSGAGSTWTCDGILQVGYQGAGTIDVTSGGFLTNPNFDVYLGNLTNSSGAVHVAGAGSAWSSQWELYIGYGGSGTLSITNGGTSTNYWHAHVGYAPGSTGTVNVADPGSSWTTTGSLFVGEGGAGWLNITSGAQVSSRLVSLGDLTGGSGQVNVSGPGSAWSTSLQLTIGNAGGGGLSITNGGHVTCATNALLGVAATGSGTVTVSGANSRWDVGGAITTGVGSGALSISDGGVVQVNASGKTNAVTTLALGGGDTNHPTGTLNLRANNLVVRTGDLLTVRAAIKAARNGGAWDQSGLTTDMSGAIAGKVTTLAYAAGSDTNVVGNFSNGDGGQLDGQTYGPQAVIVKYTYVGDANLDGSVDGLDIARWADNFTGALGMSPTGTPAKVWTEGDWNFDGSVDGLDAALWATNFTGALGSGGLSGLVVDAPGANPAAIATLEGMGITVVPERASLLLLAAGGLALLSGRRRAL